jgi:hypothetical protein
MGICNEGGQGCQRAIGPWSKQLSENVLVVEVGEVQHYAKYSSAGIYDSES